MQRYESYAEILKTSDGRRRYSTMFYPTLPKKDTDIYLIAKKSDRLDLLAHRYYGDRRLWILIAKVNKLHSPSIRIPTGRRIRIPYPLDTIELDHTFTEMQI